MAIRNLLPYSIQIVSPQGDFLHFFPSSVSEEDSIRTEVSMNEITNVEETPIMGMELGDSINLPDFQGGDYDYLIVSPWTLAAHPERVDLLTPWKEEWNFNDKVIAYRGLTRNPLLAIPNPMMRLRNPMIVPR